MAQITSITTGASTLESNGDDPWLNVELSARVGRHTYRGCVSLGIDAQGDLGACGDDIDSILGGDLERLVRRNTTTAGGRQHMLYELVSAAVDAVDHDTLARLRADTLYDSDTAEALSAQDLDCTDERYRELVWRSVRAAETEGHIEFRGRRVYAQ
jgi:hypothetical protein